MHISTKYSKFIWPVLAYLLFIFQWLSGYHKIWYSNLPEEAFYCPKKPNIAGLYMVSAYFFIAGFIAFIICGAVALAKKSTSKYLTYALIAILLFSAFIVWRYTLTFADWHILSDLLFVDLALFAVAIFKLVRPFSIN